MSGPDLGKLARLQLDLSEMEARADGLRDRIGEQREALSRAVLMFRPERHAERHWRPGDDVAVFLDLPPEDQDQCRAECSAARKIVAMRVTLAALMARADELTPALVALRTLVRACERYAADATRHPKDSLTCRLGEVLQ